MPAVERTLGALGDGGDATTAGQIGEAAKKLEELAADLKAAKADDTARAQAIQEEMAKHSEVLTTLQAKHQQEEHVAAIGRAEATAKAALEYAQGVRHPSKAGIVSGSGGKGLYVPSGYQRGSFITAIMGASGRDAEAQAAGKAALAEMGLRYQTPEEAGSKATLGTTDATGGWVTPNAIVDMLIKPGRYVSPVPGLVTERGGLANVPSVDIPFRRGAPARAVVAPWGDTKENVDLTYEGYTATLYTVARVHDISKQFARKSAGAAEADVMEELAHAFSLGKTYYILQGAGSSEPYGLQTALALAGASTFTTSHTASDTTLAGSKAKAIAKAAGALAGRERRPEAAVMSATSYWTMLGEGTDEAGFFFANPANSPVTIAPGTLISPFGVPVFPENQLAGSDDLIVGQWSELKVYLGEDYRVDTSDQAGERWDKNLIGFRGEMEMGLDARPAVFAGAFQFVADIVA